MAVFTCPDCGHSQAVDDKHTGKTATCPQCKARGMVGADTEIPHTPAATDHDEVEVRRAQGEKIGIFYSRGYDRFENKDSTLRHEWIVIDSPRMLMRFVAPSGITPCYDRERSNDHHVYYHYRALLEVALLGTPISAFEIRFLTFDIWGNHVRTLAGTDIRDMRPPKTQECVYQWNLYDEHEAWHHVASIGYIARVRTLAGMVIEADTATILREAQRFSEKFSEADLQPKAPIK